MTQTSQKSPSWLIALAWLIVAIPLAWGLYQSLIKSEPLFAAPASQRAPARASN